MASVTVTCAIDLPQPPKVIWRWTTDLRIVNTICRPLAELRYDLSMPPWLYEGAVIPIEMRIAGCHAAWATIQIVSWQSPTLFVDEGLVDGRRWWRHEHVYLPIEGGTRYVDRMTITKPRLLSSRLPVGLFLKFRQRNLRRLFDQLR